MTTYRLQHIDNANGSHIFESVYFSHTLARKALEREAERLAPYSVIEWNEKRTAFISISNGLKVRENGLTKSYTCKMRIIEIDF